MTAIISLLLMLAGASFVGLGVGARICKRPSRDKELYQAQQRALIRGRADVPPGYDEAWANEIGRTEC